MQQKLKIPISDEDVRKLHMGDIIYLSGTVYTARDEAHIHILEELRRGKRINIDFKGRAIFHCGPIVRKTVEEWQLVAAGPTTSSRMNSLEPEFIERTGIKAIIGKGGMSKPTIEAMAKFGCVYLSLTGGAAVLAAKGITKVGGVYLEQLGMPEAVWILEAENFGPLIVGIDTKGNSWYEQVRMEVEKRTPAVKSKLGI